jgi:hypothetical protein
MATAAQRARYSSLRGDFEDTAASRLLDRILVDLQIEFGPVHGQMAENVPLTNK